MQQRSPADDEMRDVHSRAKRSATGLEMARRALVEWKFLDPAVRVTELDNNRDALAVADRELVLGQSHRKKQIRSNLGP